MKNKNNKEAAQKVLAALRNNGNEISAIGLFRLIIATNGIQTPTFAVLHDYTSDKSDNTELADYTVNLGTKYANALDTSAKKIADIGTAELVEIAELCTPEQIKGFAYINRKGLSEIDYCTAVKLALPLAVEEMKTVIPRTTDNVIRINHVLTYNTNTDNLLISGELIKGGKKTTIVGVPKLVAKAPKTVAKEVITAYLNTRTSKIRTFAITNLHTVSVAGQKITLHQM